MLLSIEQAKSPLTIKVALDRVAKAGLELTPEAMIMILKCTNHKVSIRDVLKMVPEGKEADFKEAICSAVEHREHTEANLERMREIAKIGGFEAEFEEAHAKEKWIGDTYKRTFIAKSNEDLENNPDLTGYGTVICDFEGITKFADLTKLPKRMIIKGNIDWRYRDFEKLPDISESIIYGSFYCSGCTNITSLEGSPKKVGGYFNCGGTDITSLDGAPKEVGGGFNCRECNGLTSLEGAPEKVGGNFNCDKCWMLPSLKGVPEKVGGVIHCTNTPLNESLGGKGIYIKRDKEVYDIFNLPKDKEFVINGNLYFKGIIYLEKLPDLTNVIVKGDFNCHGCKNLTSLEGAPKEVGGDFECWGCNGLTSLRGAPKKVGGDFDCCKCSKLESLEGAPKEVGGDFNCYDCKNLTSLDGAPKEVGGSFYCSECSKLESLDGAPEKVGGSFNCDDCDNLVESGRYLVQDGQYYDLFNLPKDKEFVINGNLGLLEYKFEQLPDLSNVIVKGDFTCRECSKLTSLEGAPKEVGGNFDCGRCDNLTSAKGLPMHIGGEIYCGDKLRPEIDKELEKRKNQSNQQTLPPNGFSNSGR